MDSKVGQDAINHLIGEAIKLLSENGAPAGLLGVFASEYPKKVSAILGAPAKQDATPDLEQAVLAAMKKFVAEGELVPAGLAAERGTERVYVMVAGQRTSVSVKKPILAKLTEQLGSEASAKKKIREIALGAPEETAAGSRSDWIERQVSAFLMVSRIQPTGPAH